ncbi:MULTISPECIES: glutamyl-tRNA reductase [Halomicrobium]|uniref:Glutamyl-tRNA reductase n=2 Tax=Halomicrobium mukohataei TaxID=57705 RepID=C7P3Q4_HALMD|nr:MULTISPECIES: glutamyl-tRNA reductase [Halomicrobium]ACV47726.1 glutamyl-tRNA reductase [Halomicrobium mukohataei DSM 12286]QCD66179.1 glutamyl-tRNA reductase [Halomicrobium mukohataei]QFR20984.1 glutamyl-tRNA reductase [Halomicrobium sp. ZPS1]
MKAGTGVISGVSVAHEHATVEDREAAATESQRHAVESLLTEPAVEEAFALQTCNRIEGYVVTEEGTDDALSLFTDSVDDDAVVRMDHEQSLRHLLRVAAGLESIVLGEDQILGQVRRAYQDARAVGGIGSVLEDGITKAIHVGERARTETAINEGSVSIASAAVGLATDECTLDGETGVVVGAGEMGTRAAKSLAPTVDRLVVANRTVPNAEYVAETVDVEATAVSLDAVESLLSEARVVVTATGSPEPQLDTETLATAGETFVVDIAQPRDVPTDADSLSNITVCDMDTLESLTEETRDQRRTAATAVEAMVDEEFDHLLNQYKRKRADQVISAMYESADHVKASELQTAFSKLDLDDDQQAVVESMADAIVSQLLAAPTQSLREAAQEDDWSTINTALQLFDPDFGPDTTAGGPPAFSEGMSVDDIPEGMREEIPASMLEQLGDD